MRITDAFRRSMGWLHTWFGVVLGGLCFAIFWMGSLSVFDREIDQWMMPGKRLAAPPADISYDRLLEAALPVVGGSTYINMLAPDPREPSVRIYYRDDSGAITSAFLDPHTGTVLDVTDSLAGTGFIFPFHYGLHISWGNLGYWLVGFAGLSMVLLLVSGIFIHRKIVAEFFVFRPQKKPRRSLLDLHNLTSLVGLPFHLFISVSGLLIFAYLYFPWGTAEPFGGDTATLYQETHGAYDAGPPTGEPGGIGSLDAMVAATEAHWSAQAGKPIQADIIRVLNHGDASAVVYLRSTFPARRIALSEFVTVIDAETGDIVSDFRSPPVRHVSAWIEGAHFVQFQHWPLRWFYFLGGLSGCVMIATGLLFWINARIRKGGAEPLNVRLVRALTVGGTTGIIAATLAFFVVNRLLPKEAAWLGQDRSELEVWGFLLVWILGFAHAAMRNSRAWADQAWAIAVLAVSAATLNWITTGDHVIAAAREGLWCVMVFDLTLLMCAVVAALIARRLTIAAGAAADRLGIVPAPTARPTATAAE